MMRNSDWFQEQRRIVAYLDGLSERVNKIGYPACPNVLWMRVETLFLLR